MALTGLYAVFFLASAVGLLVLLLGLVVHSTGSSAVACAQPRASNGSVGPARPPAGGSGYLGGFAQGGGGGQVSATTVGPCSFARAGAVQQHNADLHQLLISSALALAAMTVIALLLGRLMAGRVLRPIQAMTVTTRQISATSLHLRLAARGARDEVKDLADTIDGLLERLEDAFDAQKRFITNAAHELSTPLTLQRALLEVALADPDASAASLRAACAEVLGSNEDQARLIEALLTLATSERGLEARVAVDLGDVARRVLHLRGDEADQRGLVVRSAVAAARVAGNRELLERLMANLVDNALRHNRPGGWMEVATAETGGRAVIRVCNSGPVVPQSEVGRLFLPFQRLWSERTGSGHGLGLSIVAAIARAHEADVCARARSEGGLDIEVRFRAV